MSKPTTMSAIDKTNSLSAEFPLSVTRIEIEKLFGKYTYDLSKEVASTGSLSSLFILYGDNGSGKTTILKLLFHLLSPSEDRGHRSFIAQIPFAKFAVSLAGGTHIVVSRQEKDLLGPFQIELLEEGKSVSKVKYEINEDGRPQGLDGNLLLRRLSELQLSVFFLGDDRVLNSDVFESEETELQQFFLMSENRRMGLDPRRFLRTSSHVANIDRDFALKTSIARTENWIREQALKGSNRGSASVHNLYEDIISRIITSGKGEIVSEDLPHSSQQLIERLQAEEDRSKEFSYFGLMSPLDTKNLIRTIGNNNSEATLTITWKVLKPYLDSVSARLDALQETQNLLKLFVSTVNSFFNDKKIELHVRTGLKIATEKGQEISPESLSSGEKQLLLLLCNTLTARDKATIFIIDEPEISLNIKWQRQLIHVLLEFTKGSLVQFLLATHSIELLAQYRRNVVKLQDVSNEIENGR
ncbi:AAA family ATPase [Microcoleus sp. herbarium2]|uniref:AAA family ATPase n=1 Tax=Microcoleus sp. herbarium2 TaxID=3055433 RepID=UPI002FD279FC